MRKDIKAKKLAGSGFSLIELMVSLVIGLILLLGVFQLYGAMSKSYNQMGILGERQQALRFVVEVLSDDIRAVGRRGAVADEPQNEDGSIVYILQYDPPRESGFYCAPGEVLKQLDYIFNSEDGTISARSTCNFSVGSKEIIVDGVEDFQIVASPYGNAAALVRLSFFNLPQESDVSRSFRYVVANRDAVMGRVEVATD